MDTRDALKSLWVRGWIVGFIAAAAGCSAGEDGTLVGADETAVTSADITAHYAVGTVVATTADLNLRTGPSTSDHIILVMANGSHATIVDSAPQGGWYHLRYGSTVGWSYGGYLRVVSTPGGVTAAFDRARAGVGFSYEWGGGRWLMSGPTSSTRGSCVGNCPSCTHYGSYGADCSGFVAKVWAVPASNDNVSVGEHPYSTWNFYNTDGGGQWSRINRSNARHGDALVYNSGSEGHIVLFDSGDPWGSMWTYEARGCSYGIVHNIRTASSAFVAIRRAGF
jgi:hypothetical protein